MIRTFTTATIVTPPKNLQLGVENSWRIVTSPLKKTIRNSQPTSIVGNQLFSCPSTSAIKIMPYTKRTTGSGGITLDMVVIGWSPIDVVAEELSAVYWMPHLLHHSTMTTGGTSTSIFGGTAYLPLTFDAIDSGAATAVTGVSGQYPGYLIVNPMGATILEVAFRYTPGVVTGTFNCLVSEV